MGTALWNCRNSLAGARRTRVGMKSKTQPYLERNVHFLTYDRLVFSADMEQQIHVLEALGGRGVPR